MRNKSKPEIILGTTVTRSGKNYVVDIGDTHYLYDVKDKNDAKYPDRTGVLVAMPKDTKNVPFIIGESGRRIPVAVRYTV